MSALDPGSKEGKERLAEPTGTVLEEGSTCWRIANAGQFAVIVDAADYFKALRAAVMEARHSVLLIGWDVDTRVILDHDARDGAPNRLGRFLSWAAKRRPELTIYVLRWEIGLLLTLGRGSTPLFLIDWVSRRNVRFQLDSAHPTTAAHHQKIVVIDDVVAFCGGIDVTGDRWDRRAHAVPDPRRIRPTTHRRYGPWHDATTVADGDIARALGDLARERWKKATGEDIPPPPASAEPIWPPGIRPMLRNVNVGIARTYPEYRDQREVREIESLTLAAIGAARRSVYIESQYFASRVVAEAICRRLEEPDGPEFVIVNPESADGWLEEKAMGSARALLLEAVRTADRHDRFRIFTPVTDTQDPIYVHAKILIVDDDLLRVGSSNLNNRSMGYDTECDLVVEAARQDDPADVQRTIGMLRADLLAEHLGRSVA
jgi:phospholipase D1/2